MQIKLKIPTTLGSGDTGVFWNAQAVWNLLQRKQYSEGDGSEPPQPLITLLPLLSHPAIMFKNVGAGVRAAILATA